jgi:hypothetical protein
MNELLALAAALLALPESGHLYEALDLLPEA